MQSFKPLISIKILTQTRTSFPYANFMSKQRRLFSTIDAAVPAHEVEQKSFAHDYDEFIKLQRKQRSLPMNALTSFIN